MTASRSFVRTLALATAAAATGLAGAAVAQPGVPPTAPAPAPTPPAPPPVDASAPTAAPEPPPPAAVHAEAHGDVGADAHHGHGHGDGHGDAHGGHGHGHGGHRNPEARPESLTVGLGLGYALPTSWETPNVTSARFRLVNGLVIEPRVQLSVSGSKIEDDTFESESSRGDLALGARVRIPLASRGRADFVLVGGAGVGFSKTDPDGGDEVSTTTLGLTWGIGIDYWLGRSWSISATAGNPLVAVTSSTTESAGGAEVTESSYAFGAVFDPELDLMLHLYF